MRMIDLGVTVASSAVFRKCFLWASFFVLSATTLGSKPQKQSLPKTEPPQNVAKSKDAVASQQESDLIGSQYPQWRTLRNLSTVATIGRRPVLIGLFPRSYSIGSPEASLSVRLITKKAGLHNRWLLRYIRDGAVQVSVASIGTISSTDQLEIETSINLTALDLPTSGNHTYSVQVRYVGDSVEGQFGHLVIKSPRLAAIGL
jgi:hypothetical protein